MKESEYTEIAKRMLVLVEGYADDSFGVANKVVLLANSGGVAAVIAVGKLAEGPSLTAALSFSIGLLVAGSGPVTTAISLWFVQWGLTKELSAKIAVERISKKLQETEQGRGFPIDLDKLEDAERVRPEMKNAFWPIPVSTTCFVIGAITLFLSVFS